MRNGSILAGCAVVLLILWVIIPGQIGRPDSALITLRAEDATALVWFGASCAATGAILSVIVWLLHDLRTARGQRVSRVVRQYLNEGVALCDQRGNIQWVNEAGQTLLIEAGKLRNEAQTVLIRAVVTHKTTLQGIVIGERSRLTLQAIPLGKNIALIARQAQNEGGQAQFYERFMQRIVHDMRNPLAAIIAHAGNLRADPTPDPRAAQIIESEALRLTRLVDSLLFDARLTYVPLHAESLDLTELLQEVIYQFEERTAEENKTLTLEVPSRGIVAEVDRDLMLRALGNLIDNSLKYSKVGSTIHLALQVNTDRFTLSVADDGDGIPPEYLPDRIFDPLVRAHPKDSGSGSGLGLAIVKKIVELHGGQIAAESTRGKGTRITLWLPR